MPQPDNEIAQYQARWHHIKTWIQSSKEQFPQNIAYWENELEDLKTEMLLAGVSIPEMEAELMGGT